MRPPPQFKARIKLTFEEHGDGRLRKFTFYNGHRRLPMSMDGLAGLHTVGLWIEKEQAVFEKGDEFDADCCVLWPEGFTQIVVPGVRFRLWELGFFADGVVTERCDTGWVS